MDSGRKIRNPTWKLRFQGLETKVFNRAVKRNIERFPDDFMFQLNEKEAKILRYQFGTLETGRYSKYLPYLFTEQGVTMLSAVLKSKRAIQVSIQVVRIFVKLREMLATHKELREKIEKMERKYDGRFKVVFDVLKKFLKTDPRGNEMKITGFQKKH